MHTYLNNGDDTSIQDKQTEKWLNRPQLVGVKLIHWADLIQVLMHGVIQLSLLHKSTNM